MSKILGKNFKYSIDYDYDTQYSCEDSGCIQEGICRCGVIYDSKINSVDMDAIGGDIYAEYFDNSVSTKRDNNISSIVFGVDKEINIYTIDRVLRHFKIWDQTNWEIGIEGGYYGQELGDITIINSVASEIESCLDIAFSIDELNGRIEYLLGLEYGHLLPELTGCEYEVIDINREDIIYGNEDHYEKVKSKKLDHYLDSNYDGIRGIVILKERKAGNQWRLLDGYHRCSSTKKDKVKVLKAY